MFRRRKQEPRVIVIEVAGMPATSLPPSVQYEPLASRDPRTLLYADLILNTPVEKGSMEIPAEVREWAASIAGKGSHADPAQ